MLDINKPENVSAEYAEAREAYWEQERRFRDTAVKEIVSKIPGSAWGIALDINDTPRLTVAHWINEDNEPFDPYPGDDDEQGDEDTETPFEEIDEIASDMNVTTFEEGDSFLGRGLDLEHCFFVITREV